MDIKHGTTCFVIESFLFCYQNSDDNHDHCHNHHNHVRLRHMAIGCRLLHYLQCGFAPYSWLGASLAQVEFRPLELPDLSVS